MKITFDNKGKEGLLKLLEKSSDKYVRIKASLACGSAYYDIYTDFKREDDALYEICGIKFIVDKYSEKAAKDIIILYDEEIYNKGFYIKENK